MEMNDGKVDEVQIEKMIEVLGENGIKAMVVKTKEDAKTKVLELIPKGSEVMTMTSVTLDQIGIASVINDGDDYVSVRKKLSAMDRSIQGREMQAMGAVPEWVVGSVNALTLEGEVVFASNTGSQMAAYVYGAEHVVWVVGIQKIVENMEMAMKRLYEHVLPLESERAHKAYGVDGSYISKVLTIKREVRKNRINLIIVRESLGF